jgi:DUF438 domain-containing protein
MSDGGITVTKTTTGSILLYDIQVMVHHQIPTFIPADKVLNSADLHRALGSKAIFQMLNTMHTSKSSQDLKVLEDENRQLREALMRSTQQGSSLQQSVEGLARQVETLTAAVGKIGTVTATSSPGTRVSANPQSEVVGGEIPMFIPDAATPSGEVQLQVQEVLSEGDGVSDARSKLRQLRKGQSG